MLRRLKQTYRRWLRGRDALRIECERRLLDHQSFEEAESFAWVLCPPIEILKTGYPEDIRRAVSVACVVSYARPFSGQRDRFGESERDLRFEKLYRSQLSDPEDRALHNRMLKLRHKFFGHADAAGAGSHVNSRLIRRIPISPALSGPGSDDLKVDGWVRASRARCRVTLASHSENRNESYWKMPRTVTKNGATPSTSLSLLRSMVLDCGS